MFMFRCICALVVYTTGVIICVEYKCSGHKCTRSVLVYSIQYRCTVQSSGRVQYNDIWWQGNTLVVIVAVLFIKCIDISTTHEMYLADNLSCWQKKLLFWYIYTSSLESHFLLECQPDSTHGPVRPAICLSVRSSQLPSCCQSSYDVARLHRTTLMTFWQNFTPFFGAAALCMKKIGNFIKLPQKWKWP